MTEINGNKSGYVNEIVAEGCIYPDLIIEALKEFKRNHKMTRNPDDFAETMVKRLAGMQNLVNAFGVCHEEKAPEVIAVALRIDGDSFDSHYLPAEHKIVMHGKLSIITLLHEYAHSLGANEHEARKWSINLFKRVYPKAYERLQMLSDSPASFALVERSAIQG